MHATNCRILLYLDIVGVRSDAGLEDLEPILEAPGIEQAHSNVVADHLAHLKSRGQGAHRFSSVRDNNTTKYLWWSSSCIKILMTILKAVSGIRNISLTATSSESSQPSPAPPPPPPPPVNRPPHYHSQNPDQGGPKTYWSYGSRSGSPTLLKRRSTCM